MSAVRRMIAAVVAGAAMALVAAQSEGVDGGHRHVQRLVREETRDGKVVGQQLESALASIQPHGFAFVEGVAVPVAVKAPDEKTDAKDPAQYISKPGHVPLLGASRGNVSTTLHPHAVVLPGTEADNCPWLGAKGTGSDAMLCWDAQTCNPSTDGDACCVPHGGTIQCPDKMPMLCESTSCGGDHCCKVDCTDQGGQRVCETGPAGASGPKGPAGPAGKRGAEGPMGPFGAVGKQGKNGTKGEEGPEGPASDEKPPRNAVTNGLLWLTVALNSLLGVLMYLSLKYWNNLKKHKETTVGY